VKIPEARTMRDVMIPAITEKMETDKNIFFLSADFGAPSLDKMRARFPDRFISVGIAEQNMIGVAAGLALEGFTVFVYGIAPFLAMRDFEQIRVQLAMLSQTRVMNVNLMSVGAGISYDVSGPTHHCIEDLSIIRTLPNIALFSPSDWIQARQFVDFAISRGTPKYARLDGESLQVLSEDIASTRFDVGFRQLSRGNSVCLVATGFAVHKAAKIVDLMSKKGAQIGLVDMFMLKPFDEEALAAVLSKYERIVTIEEAFLGKGGLDSLILNVVNRNKLDVSVSTWGFKDTYFFDNGGRDYLHELYGMPTAAILDEINRK